MKKEKEFEYEEYEEEECDEKTFKRAIKRKSFNKLLLPVCLLSYVFVGTFSFLPKIVSSLLCGAALALPVIISFIREKKNMKPLSKVFALLCAAYLLFHLLVTDPAAAVTLNIIAIGALLVYTLLSFFCREYDATNLFLVILPAFTLRNLYDAENYFYFLVPAIVCGIVAAIASFLIVKKKEGRSKSVYAKTFSALFMVAVFAFFALGRLNYSLDSSEPRIFECVIEEKEHTHYRKSPDTYRFKLDTGVEIDVTSRIYSIYDEGDRITVYIYSGALGSPYYTLYKK